MSDMNEQEKLEEQIDAIEDLHEMSEDEVERVVAALSEEGLKLRRERKAVRYQLYRLKSDAEGKSQAESTKEFREIFESQRLFDGWRRFGESWDVALDDPYRIVHRIRSVAEEWEEIIAAKFPKIEGNGTVVYPDITVRKRVEHQAEIDALRKKHEEAEARKKK